MASQQNGSSLETRLIDVVFLLQSCSNINDVRYAYDRLIHKMERCLELAKLARERTGQPPRLKDLEWLSKSVATHPAFERLSADAKAMQGELQGLVARIGRGQ
jgi:hypothetical protein